MESSELVRAASDPARQLQALEQINAKLRRAAGPACRGMGAAGPHISPGAGTGRGAAYKGAGRVGAPPLSISRAP